ncbi:MAG TPA: hypothetical protein VGI39_17135 [Polyangiaceae bacterium]|jgi:hypothetical protein
MASCRVLQCSFVALVFAARVASAQEQPPASAPAAPSVRSPAHAGFEASVSIGYALPAGSVTATSGDDLSHVFSGQVPIRMQFGANVAPWLFLGTYVSVAVGGAGDGLSHCADGTLSCSSSGFRGGLVAEYHFDAGPLLAPWIGYGLGFEINTAYANLSNSTLSSVNVQGWDLAVLRGGLDVFTSDVIAVGVYGEASIGEYKRRNENPAIANRDGDITNTAIHEWFSFGVRARVMP